MNRPVYDCLPSQESPPPSSPRRPARTAGALALLALLGSAVQAQQVVIAEEIAQEEVQRRERVIGSLRAASSATLAALEEGALVEVAVKEGAAVEKGAVIARTDTRRLVAMRNETRAELAAAEAIRRQREAELENAKQDLVAIEAAARDNAVSDRVLREARMTVAVREAQILAAAEAISTIEGRLELLEVRIDDAVVRAPFDGEVIARHAEPGEWIRPGEPIVTLNSTGTIEAWLEVPERFIGDLDLDAVVLVETSATGREFRSVRNRLLPQVHERARTFSLIAEIETHGGALKPGMSISAWIPVGKRVAGTIVPKDAVLRRGGAVLAYRVNTEGEASVAELVHLQVLFELPEHVVVEAGALNAGELVVVEGNERLAPGAPVRLETRSAETAGIVPDPSGRARVAMGDERKRGG